MKTKNIMRSGCIFFFITSLLILGCKGEKVEAPPSKSDIQTDQTTGLPQQPAAPSDPEVTTPMEVKTPRMPNTPSEVVSINLNPKLVYPGTTVKAEVEGMDKDGDPITFYYEWKRNNMTLHEETREELDTKEFKKGDFISVIVTPFDGKEKGKNKRSLFLFVANSPPTITSFPTLNTSNEIYVYEVKATDPDGDALTFSLEESPPGMTIDAATGRIEWKIPSETKGSFQVKITVTDNDSKAFQGFGLDFKREIQ